MSARVDPNEVWLTVDDAAARMSCAPSLIRAAMKRTEQPILPARNIGQGKQPRYRIALSDLNAWFRALDEAV